MCVDDHERCLAPREVGTRGRRCYTDSQLLPAAAAPPEHALFIQCVYSLLACTQCARAFGYTRLQKFCHSPFSFAEESDDFQFARRLPLSPLALRRVQRWSLARWAAPARSFSNSKYSKCALGRGGAHGPRGTPGVRPGRTEARPTAMGRGLMGVERSSATLHFWKAAC